MNSNQKLTKENRKLEDKVTFYTYFIALYFVQCAGTHKNKTVLYKKQLIRTQALMLWYVCIKYKNKEFIWKLLYNLPGYSVLNFLLICQTYLSLPNSEAHLQLWTSWISEDTPICTALQQVRAGLQRLSYCRHRAVRQRNLQRSQSSPPHSKHWYHSDQDYINGLLLL